jgi:hypothetical protein
VTEHDPTFDTATDAAKPFDPPTTSSDAEYPSPTLDSGADDGDTRPPDGADAPDGPAALDPSFVCTFPTVEAPREVAGSNAIPVAWVRPLSVPARMTLVLASLGMGQVGTLTYFFGVESSSSSPGRIKVDERWPTSGLRVALAVEAPRANAGYAALFTPDSYYRCPGG